MKNSGEQFILGASEPRLQDEHLARYAFAGSFVQGKDVLDVACGTGYGSSALAETAKSVIGVDLSEEAVAHAKANFSKANLEFRNGDCSKLDFRPGQFDVIVSFETIEHLEEKGRLAFLSSLEKYLKPEGKLLLSTPNKIITSPYTDKPLNRFHVLEFTRDTLRKEIEAKFRIEKWYGQRFIHRILANKIVRKSTRLLEKIVRKDFGIYYTMADPAVKEWEDKCQEPRILLLIAKKYEHLE